MHLCKKTLRLRYDCITIIQYIHTDLKTFTFAICLTSNSPLSIFYRSDRHRCLKDLEAGFRKLKQREKKNKYSVDDDDCREAAKKLITDLRELTDSGVRSFVKVYSILRQTIFAENTFVSVK